MKGRPVEGHDFRRVERERAVEDGRDAAVVAVPVVRHFEVEAVLVPVLAEPHQLLFLLCELPRTSWRC